MNRSLAKTLVFSVLCFSFFSCGNPTSPAVPKTGDSALRAVPAKATVSRPGLIGALHELARRAGSKDSTVVAGIYTFPIYDSIMNLYLDSAFESLKAQQGGGVTESLFLSHYDRLNGLLGLKDLVSLFKDIDVDQLRKKDTLEYEENPKKHPSYELGSIEVSGDTLVHLRFGINTNSDYVGTQEEKDAADAGGYEGTIFWTFKFDGKKLYLVKMDVAG